MCKEEHTDDTLESTLGEELPNIAITLQIEEELLLSIVRLGKNIKFYL